MKPRRVVKATRRAGCRRRGIANRSVFVATVGIVVLSLSAPAVAVTPSIAGAATPTVTVAPLPVANTFPIPAPNIVRFSDNWHACRDGCSRLHKGNDVFAAEGAPEIAVESGVVAAINNTDSGNGGLYIWLRGDSGNAYFYAHNSANLVTLGQRVGRGQMIGLVGHTGNATEGASHIHFQINRCGQLDSSEPCTVDPYTLLTSWPQELTDGGADSIGLYTPADASFHLRSESGSALAPVKFGGPGDLPITGDWDGDGRDTIGVYRPSNATFYLSDGRGKTTAIPFGLVPSDALPLAGDWDGDGRDSVALYRRADATFYFRDLQGRITPSVGIGRPGEDLRPLTGDWDGDRR